MLWALVLCLGIAVATIAVAISQPWLGLRLAGEPGEIPAVRRVIAAGPAATIEVAAGQTVVAIGTETAPPLRLDGGDLLEEPDGLESYAALRAFFDRQTALAAMLRSGPLQLTLADAASGAQSQAVIAPAQRRPVSDLPSAFWIQLFSGLAGFAIGAWVWAMRRADLGSTMFALSGLGLLVSALPAAIYSTRELAIDGTLFSWLSVLNHLGVHLFGGAMIALFLLYPRRLVPPGWLAALPVILAACLGADLAGLAGAPVIGTYVPMVAEMAAIVVLVLVQWRLARRDPATRAALRWLGLSVIVGAGAFVLGIGVPLLLDARPAISQGHAFAFFLLVYGGIALGIRRYRLFDLGDWAFRILFYAGGALLLLLLDAALVWALQIDRGPALGISLLLIGFGYLPLRDMLRRRLFTQRRLSEHELFALAMDIAFGITRSERAERWQGLLRRLYDPLEITTAAASPAHVVADSDGLGMTLPAVADAPALRLRYPQAGQALFAPRDRQLADQLVALVRQAEASRSAYDRGVAEERQRIARDLHDDVGARLLTGLHHADEQTRPLLQAALADIRAIVSGLAGDRMPLDRVLADARHETARRLESAGIALDWRLSEDGADRHILDYRQSKALLSSIREIVSNVIRHSGATALRVEVGLDENALRLTLADNGRGMAAAATEDGGYGLVNIRRRIAAIGGTFGLSSSGAGTTADIAMPLARTPAGPPESGLAGHSVGVGLET